MTPINIAKRQLRKQMRALLGTLSAAHINEASARACQHILALDTLSNATHVALYVSTARELQTRDLIARLLAMGKRVYVPRCDAEMEMVRITGFGDLTRETSWGIWEPEGEGVDPHVLDFVLVPGVAFDRRGNRCGHGRGYYDRYLARTAAFACAVCLDEQIVDEVPTAEHDRTPDLIVAPQGAIFTKNHPSPSYS
ncbi:hypothetical protein GGI25_001967 [Coemansia spiralis]|uniref:5-formyltetrahydrofolate cyclo-ligase n=2 Tax=Coemansia TaxID=4863 RepID=A0A9W8G907_9FUNG|nr:hypothetical protein EDC05_002265 [Coemansia umbellata]KAJ2623452.1 hypothetical protein GGI26_002291 [Coemansia sp. RSA 1358]KAJ2678978.1 hypothetical protein GGI25_001967 [Coemansia spiralis]